MIPLDNSYEVDQVCLCVGYLAFCISLLCVSRLTFVLSVVLQATTEMYSTPNGAQGSTEEGEGSGGESGDDQVEWESDGEGEEGDDIFSSEEEEEAEPSRPEGRSKLAHDPAQERGKATAPVG